MNLYEVIGDPRVRRHGFDSALVRADTPEQAIQMVVDVYLDEQGRPRHEHGPALGDPARFTVEEVGPKPGVLHIGELD